MWHSISLFKSRYLPFVSIFIIQHLVLSLQLVLHSGHIFCCTHKKNKGFIKGFLRSNRCYYIVDRSNFKLIVYSRKVLLHNYAMRNLNLNFYTYLIARFGFLISNIIIMYNTYMCVCFIAIQQLVMLNTVYLLCMEYIVI